VPNILITGASRGMGLEWARQCAERGWKVYATCRDPFEAGELRRLAEKHATITMHPLDVTDPAQVATLARALPQARIDVVVLNAGVWRDWDAALRIGKLDFDGWEETLQVNLLGAARVVDALVEHVARSDLKLFVGITSEMGCLSTITAHGSYAYRASKAGLNAMLHGMAIELRRRDIGVLLLHPGWVRTQIGGETASLSPEQSVAGMLDRVEGFTMEQSGRLFTYDGRELKW
jgi:NAD(P)-dependent dehydrogenase (short-subunit alcohol dehydrogenase family)